MSESKLEFSEFFAIQQAEVILLDLEEYLCESRKLYRGIQPKGDQTKFIDPITRRNWRMSDNIRLLKHIVASEKRKGVPERDIWVAFTEVDKLGVNVNADNGCTPLGIYAYPISSIIDESAKGDFKNRPFMQVFKIRRTYSKSRSRKPAIYSTSAKDAVVKKRERRRPSNGYYSGSRIYDFQTLRRNVTDVKNKLSKIPNFNDALREERKKIIAWAHQYLGIPQLSAESVDIKTSLHKEDLLKHLEDQLKKLIVRMTDRFGSSYIDPVQGILKVQEDRKMALDFLQGMENNDDFDDKKKDAKFLISSLRDFIEKIDVDGNYDNWNDWDKKYTDPDFDNLTVKYSQKYLKLNPNVPKSISIQNVFDDKDNQHALNYFSDNQSGGTILQKWEKFLALKKEQKKTGQTLQDIIQSKEWANIATLVLRRLNKFVSNYKRTLIDPIINTLQFPFHQRIKKYAEINHLSWFTALYGTLWNHNPDRVKNGAGFILWMANNLAIERRDKKKYGTIRKSSKSHPILGLGLAQAKQMGKELKLNKKIEKGKTVDIESGKYAGKTGEVLAVKTKDGKTEAEVKISTGVGDEHILIPTENLTVTDSSIKSAMMSGGKDAKQWQEWTAVLRGLGIDGFTDREGWSVIHSGEPKQGVFFDSGSLIPIAKVDNRSHLDPRDVHGRPKISYYNLMTQFKKKRGIDFDEDIPYEKEKEWNDFLKSKFKKIKGIPDDAPIPGEHAYAWENFKSGMTPYTTNYNQNRGRFDYVREKEKQRVGRTINYRTDAGSLERTFIGIRQAIEDVSNEIENKINKAYSSYHDDNWQKLNVGTSYLIKIIQTFNRLSQTFEQKVIKGSIKPEGIYVITNHITDTRNKLNQIKSQFESLIREPKYQAWLHGPWRAFRNKIDVVRNLIQQVWVGNGGKLVNVPRYSSKEKPLTSPKDLQKLDILYPYHKEVSHLPDKIKWTHVRDLALSQIERYGKDAWYALVKHQAARGLIGTQSEINDQIHRWDWFWNDENLEKMDIYNRNYPIDRVNKAQMLTMAKTETGLINLARYQLEKNIINQNDYKKVIEKWLPVIKTREVFENDPTFKQIPAEATNHETPAELNKIEILELGKIKYEKLIDYFLATKSINEKQAASYKKTWAKIWNMDLNGIDLKLAKKNGYSIEQLATMPYEALMKMGINNVNKLKRLADVLLATQVISQSQYNEILGKFHLIFKYGVPENSEIESKVPYDVYDYRLNSQKLIRELELKNKPENKELAIKTVIWMLANNKTTYLTATAALASIEKEVKLSDKTLPKELSKYKMPKEIDNDYGTDYILTQPEEVMKYFKSKRSYIKYLRWVMYKGKINKDAYKQALIRIKEIPWISRTTWEPPESFPYSLHYDPATTLTSFSYFKSVKEWKDHLKWLFFKNRISARTYAVVMKKYLKNAKNYIKEPENAS